MQRAILTAAHATPWLIFTGLVAVLAMPWLVSAWKMRHPFELHRNDSAFVHESFRFHYEIGNFLAFPGRTVKLTVDVHYDMMPVLGSDRFEFTFPDGEVATGDDTFLHFWHSEINGIKLPVMQCSDPDLWERFIETDGAALRDLFRFTIEGGHDSLADYRDVPLRHGTRLAVRMIQFERT